MLTLLWMVNICQGHEGTESTSPFLATWHPYLHPHIHASRAAQDNTVLGEENEGLVDSNRTQNHRTVVLPLGHRASLLCPWAVTAYLRADLSPEDTMVPVSHLSSV